MGDGRWGVGDEDEDVWTFLICFVSCVRVQALDMGVRRWEDWEDDSKSRKWVGDCQICLLGVLILSSVLMLGRRGEYSIGYPVMVQQRGGNVWC